MSNPNPAVHSTVATEQDQILNREEMLALLASFACEACGYAVQRFDHCFLIDADGFTFICPKCGAVFSAEAMEVQ